MNRVYIRLKRRKIAISFVKTGDKVDIVLMSTNIIAFVN
jgi:hypothetical protein